VAVSSYASKSREILPQVVEGSMVPQFVEGSMVVGEEVGEVRCVAVGQRKVQREAGLEVGVFGDGGNLTMAVSVNCEGERVECLTMVDDNKQSGKQQVCANSS